MPNSLPAKIIISGTGRAGTTFLVQLLTELGLDTGYTPTSWQRDYYDHCAAGLEKKLEAPDAPRVVKDPKLCETLPGILARGSVRISHAIVPVRTLEDAARSRIRVGGDGRTPGGLTGTNDPTAQRAVLGERFHTLVHTLVVHEIPHTFLHFPRFVTDADYAYRQLRPVLGDLAWEQFAPAFQRVARPDLVHDFSQQAPRDTGAPARAFVRRRWRRRLQRTFGWTAIAAAAWMIGLRISNHGMPGAESSVSVVPTHSTVMDPQIIAIAERNFSRSQLGPRRASAYLADLRPGPLPPPPPRNQELLDFTRGLRTRP